MNRKGRPLCAIPATGVVRSGARRPVGVLSSADGAGIGVTLPIPNPSLRQCPCTRPGKPPPHLMFTDK
jgi:hypothetical protein